MASYRKALFSIIATEVMNLHIAIHKYINVRLPIGYSLLNFAKKFCQSEKSPLMVKETSKIVPTHSIVRFERYY